MLFSFKCWLHRVPDRMSQWLAWRLPKPVVMWCGYRMGAHATSGQWANVSPNTVTFFDMVDRWAVVHGPETEELADPVTESPASQADDSTEVR